MVVGTERLTEVQKILKQVEYESARRKRHINEKTGYSMVQSQTITVPPKQSH